MKTLPVLIGDYYRKHALLPDQTIDCMEYTLKTIYNELSKFIVYLMLFALINLTTVYLIAYFSFITLRIFAGGLHCKTYWGCFVSSFIMIGSTILLAHIWNSVSILVLLSLISVVFPILLSPVTPSFRMIKDKKNKWVLKVTATGLTFLLISIACLCYENILIANTILISVIVTNYQLIIPKWIIRLKEIGGGKE